MSMVVLMMSIGVVQMGMCLWRMGMSMSVLDPWRYWYGMLMLVMLVMNMLVFML